MYASVAADPGYPAEPREEELPAVDRRRFADSGAAIATAACLWSAITGEPVSFHPGLREVSVGGAVPHDLDDAHGIRGLLGDQSAAIEAALMEYRLTGDAAPLEWAKSAADWALERLWDEGAGAFRAAPADASAGIDLPPMFPLLGNGEMAVALAGLSAHLGDRGYRRAAERVVESLAAESVASPAGPAIALAAQRLEQPLAETDLSGDPGDPRARALARAALAAIGPSAVIRWNGGVATHAVVCAGDLCLPPVETAQELLESLRALSLGAGGILGPYFSVVRP